MIDSRSTEDESYHGVKEYTLPVERWRDFTAAVPAPGPPIEDGLRGGIRWRRSQVVLTAADADTQEGPS